jgi:hypothetical protein
VTIFFHSKDAALKERDTIIGRITQRADDLEAQLFSIGKDNQLKVVCRVCNFQSLAPHRLLPPQVARIEEDRKQALDTLAAVRGDVFFDGVSPVTCPVLLCTGRVASFKTVVESWAAGPGRNNGEITRSLRCPATNEQTCVSSREEVEFALRVARGVGVDTSLPLVFEYARIPGGEWAAFGFYDQVALLDIGVA